MTFPCEPDRAEVSLLDVRRAEALALLRANQRGRARAGGVLGLGLLTIILAGALGIACQRPAIAIPLPSVLLLLCAELFQYYADVSVIGAARRRLEDAINAQLGSLGLIYETLVADIRKRPPLVLSERLLQASGAAVVLASIAVGAIVAFDHRSLWVEVSFSACTSIALVVAIACYRTMLVSGAIAAAALASLDVGQQ